VAACRGNLCIVVENTSEHELRRRAALGSAAIRPRHPPPLRWIAGVWVLNVAVSVAIEPWTPWRRWSRRRRIAARVLFETVFRVVAIDPMVRWSARETLKRAELEQRLREELGRPPWPEEVDRAWREAHGFDG
jgi:hypothetical protein